MVALRFIVFLFLSAALESAALTPAEWQRRTTYQVVTDRFALPEGGKDTCDDNPDDCLWGSYCGGNWKGLIEKLDYIQGMGFDAIYISPIVKNIPCGYHGFWTGDLWTVNPHYGGEEGLKALMAECDKRGIAVMLDTVYNHMGPPYFLKGRPQMFGDIVKQYAPFNKEEYFHHTYLDHCWAEEHLIPQYQRETCWMGVMEGAVSDLAHENPFVSDQFIEWTKHAVEVYGIAGIRADAVPYVNKSFLVRLKKEALPNTYIVGEVVVPQTLEEYSASYQNSSSPQDLVFEVPCAPDDGPCNYIQDNSKTAILADGVVGPVLDGVLSTLMKNWIRFIFQTTDGTYKQSFDEFIGKYHETWDIYANLAHGAIFIDTHDDARFFHRSPDWRTYQNAIAMTLFLPGVPIVYYGTEQGLVGPGGFGTNASRAPLWREGGYNVSHPLYTFTSRLVNARKLAIAEMTDKDLNEPPAFAVYPFKPHKASVISWQRGKGLVVLKRLPAETPCACVPTALAPGTTMYDGLAKDSDRAYCVMSGGFLEVHAKDGLPQVFFPKTAGSSACADSANSQCSATCSRPWTCGKHCVQSKQSNLQSLPSYSWYRSECAVIVAFCCVCSLLALLIIQVRKSSVSFGRVQQPLLADVIQ